MANWGSLLGGAAGFFLGGPPGAALGATLGGSIDQPNAAAQAADAAAAANDKSIALQQRMYEENVARQQPWLQAGQNALTKLSAASEYTPFGMDQFQADPGYAFRLAEGQKALDRQAAARGGLISGGALKAAARYGQDMGSQEYQNAFNRYQSERQARLGPLQSLAGVGQTTANTLGSAGQNYGANVGNIYSDTGYTQGNALLAAQGARTSAYGAAANMLGNSNFNFTNPFASTSQSGPVAMPGYDNSSYGANYMGR
jgi:hypothetical protein